MELEKRLVAKWKC